MPWRHFCWCMSWLEWSLRGKSKIDIGKEDEWSQVKGV